MQGYSAIVTTYNSMRTVAETLTSVLAQSVPAAEVIVVDDGSTDASADFCAAFDPRIRVVRQSNAGCGAATNTGIAQAHSAILAFCDHDDLWHPEKMAHQLARLEADPELAIVNCRQRLFRHGVPDDGTGEIRQGLTRSSLALRAEAARRIGPMIDPPGNRGDMVDWLGRARWLGLKMESIADILVLRRIIPGSMSYDRDAQRDRGYLWAAREAMLRRKAAAAKPLPDETRNG